MYAGGVTLEVFNTEEAAVIAIFCGERVVVLRNGVGTLGIHMQKRFLKRSFIPTSYDIQKLSPNDCNLNINPKLVRLLEDRRKS